MTEIPAYLKMLEEQDQQRKFKAPLFCWDIYMQNHHLRSQLLDELQRLRAFTVAAKWNHQHNFELRLLKEQQVIIITDLSLQILYASCNMFEMNGYVQTDAIGKSFIVFQRADTSGQTGSVIRDAVHKQQPFDVILTNYHRNGKRYRCRVEGYPVFDKDKKLINYIAFEQIQHLIWT